MKIRMTLTPRKSSKQVSISADFWNRLHCEYPRIANTILSTRNFLQSLELRVGICLFGINVSVYLLWNTHANFVLW